MNAASPVRTEQRTRVCAWCKRNLITRVPVVEAGKHGYSHGVCVSCSELLQLRKVPIENILEEIPAPVFYLDSEGRVRSANREACGLVDKSLAEVQHELAGDVLECMYAKLPGGCGGTEHCNGCIIRNTAMHTLNTGEPAISKSAYSLYTVDERVIRRQWWISTERYGDGVVFAVQPA